MSTCWTTRVGSASVTVQVAAAAGAGVEEVVGGGGGEHLGREQLALVRGVSRLAAGLAPLLAGRAAAAWGA